MNLEKEILTIDDIEFGKFKTSYPNHSDLNLNYIQFDKPAFKSSILGGVGVKKFRYFYDLELNRNEFKPNEKTVYIFVDVKAGLLPGFEKYMNEHFIDTNIYYNYKRINEALKVIQMKFINYCESYMIANEIEDLGNAMMNNKHYDPIVVRNRENEVSQKFLKQRELITSERAYNLEKLKLSNEYIEVITREILNIIKFYDLSVESGFEIQYDRLKSYGTFDNRFIGLTEQNDKMIIHQVAILNRAKEKLNNL